MNLLSRTVKICNHSSRPLQQFTTIKRLLTTNQWQRYIKILEIDKNSSAQEIKDSFIRLSKLYHPDNKVSGSHAKFVELKEAYDALKDGLPTITSRPSTSDGYDGIYDISQKRTRKDSFRQSQDQSPRDTMNMHHIYQVYKAINKLDEPERPRFRPLEDHHYPGTRFNRFEYSRFWDREAHAWVYVKKKSAREYNKWLETKTRNLHVIVSVIMLGILACMMNYNRMFRGPNRTS